MDMKANAHVKPNFNINGKEYNSIEEMPDDHEGRRVASPVASECRECFGVCKKGLTQ
jgi:hypothetical protein